MSVCSVFILLRTVVRVGRQLLTVVCCLPGFAVGPSSPDYDSGARDMSPEPQSLYKLLDLHDPRILQHTLAAGGGTTLSHFVELANQVGTLLTHRL